MTEKKPPNDNIISLIDILEDSKFVYKGLEKIKVDGLGTIIELHASHLKEFKGISIACMDGSNRIQSFCHSGTDINNFISLLSNIPSKWNNLLIHYYVDDSKKIDGKIIEVAKALFKTLQQTRFSIYDIVIFSDEDYYSVRFL